MKRKSKTLVRPLKDRVGKAWIAPALGGNGWTHSREIAWYFQSIQFWSQRQELHLHLQRLQ